MDDKEKKEIERIFDDFKSPQLVAVFKIDLVKSTKKTNEEILLAQKALENIFEESLRVLSIKDVFTKFEGDCYFFTFYKNGITRIMDFINYSIPELTNRLEKIKQKFRAGIDIGIVTLKKNEVTQTFEHFDIPGIHAARLEESADDNQILCTRRVFELFGDDYANYFSKKERSIRTKDREMLAYEIKPFQPNKLKNVISDYLLSNDEKKSRRNKILVVDDELTIREALKFFLEDKGFYVEQARNGAVALEAIEKEKFDLIISDVRMDEMDGIEFIKKLSQKRIDTPVIIITAFPEIDSAIEAIRNGVVEYLVKPFEMADLFEKIKSTFSNSRLKLNKVLDDSDIKLPAEINKKIFNLLDNIIEIKNASNNVGEYLNKVLNDKILYLVDDFCKNSHSIDYAITILGNQLDHLKKIINILNNIEIKNFTTSLEVIINDLIIMNENRVAINVKCNLDELTKGKIDVRLLVLLIFELIDNAINAINKNGEVNISINHLKSLNQINIDVKDNGPGLKQLNLDDIIQKKLTSKNTGHGIGLNLVKDILDLLGGKLIYAYDNGAKFSFNFDINKIFIN